MPRYFFHISTRGLDRDGTELPDLAAARREAVRTLGRLMADFGPKTEHLTGSEIRVSDEAGRDLLVVAAQLRMLVVE